jgi:hypothetical protein
MTNDGLSPALAAPYFGGEVNPLQDLKNYKDALGNSHGPPQSISLIQKSMSSK